MDEPLRELLRQREIIRQHLGWLDQQIAERQGNDDSPRTPKGLTEAVAVASIPAPKLVPKVTPFPETKNLSDADDPKPADPLAEKALSEAIRQEESSYPKAGMSDLTKMKIGCFSIFLLGTLIFLFLLFGLPFLTD